MNVHEFNCTTILIRLKIEHSFKRGKTGLKRTLNLSMNQNSCIIEGMKKHSLPYLYRTKGIVEHNINKNSCCILPSCILHKTKFARLMTSTCICEIELGMWLATPIKWHGSTLVLYNMFTYVHGVNLQTNQWLNKKKLIIWNCMTSNQLYSCFEEVLVDKN